MMRIPGWASPTLGVPALAIAMLVAAAPASASAQQNSTKTVDNNFGGKSDVTTDPQGRVVHQVDKDAKKTVREERFVEYGPNAGDSEETIQSYDAAGRLMLTQHIFTKAGKRVKGTRTARVYKDDTDPHGMPGEEMTIDPDTGNWTRPIPGASVSLGQNEPVNDISITYMLKHFPGELYPLGVGVDFSHVIAQSPSVTMRVVGAYEFYHSSGDNFSAFLGGMRFGFHGTPTVMPYAEVTGGIVKWGTTDPVIQYGGGADIKLGSRSWNLRVAGGLSTVFAGGTTFTAIRIAAGISLAF